VVPDHPDARALRLELREPLQPAGTFPHPPLLRAGLRRVQTQATRFADAIPPGSLTDRVFEVVLANSVWTAWRRLSEPRPSRAAAVAATAPPRAPVFRLAGRGTGAVDDAPTQLLHDLPLLETARTLTPHTALDDIPEQLVLDPGERLRHMLESIEPEHISLASGVPLSRATLGLEHLRGRCATLSMTSSDAAQPLTRAEYVVLEYVLGTAASADQAASASPADAPADEPAPTAVVAGTVDPLSLEEGVRALREAAGRLEESATQQERTPAEKEWALETAARLRRVSVRLLSLGELVAITDGDGRLLYGNQAFAALLSDPEGGPGERGAGEGGAWEHALASAPVGSSTLRTPLQDPYAGEWKLRRTTVMDEPASAARAYLNVLRAPTERPEDTAARVLPELEALLPELTLFASLFAGGESRRDYYVQRLHELADRVEAMPLDAGGAPTPEAAGAEAAVEA
ncbi:MAG TPA: hypothetical protein VFR37_24430, partial [Longimicrobium sp.]|nr:hypothetical protein [Longimicrobium sp.]